MYESLITQPIEATPSASGGSPGAGNAMDRALQAEGVSGQLAAIAHSVYKQESGSGRNARTSNAGAVGGMQILPSTFRSVADAGWDINNVDQNARAGVRYLKQQYEQAGGDPALTAAGYYGGPGGMEKARKGIAVSDPLNPNAPNTLQYGQQVASRLKGAGGIGQPAAAATASASGESETPYYTPIKGRYSSLITEPVAPLSTLESAKDSAVALGSGLVRGGALIANTFGADNGVAQGMNAAADSIDALESPIRKQEKAGRAELIRTAEQSGNTWEEVKAYAGSFAEAPFDTALGAIGTSAPTLLMAFIPGVNRYVATRLIAQGAMGAAQGAGSVKGAIYEDVVRKLVDSGATLDEASKVAAGAQAYDSVNAGNIAMGAILGAAAGTTGAEAGLSRIVSGAVGTKSAGSLLGRTATGVLKEAPTEALQGGQEKFSSNEALQGAGFDVPTWQGVAGQATLEGLASPAHWTDRLPSRWTRLQPQPLPPWLSARPNSPRSLPRPRKATARCRALQSLAIPARLPTPPSSPSRRRSSSNKSRPRKPSRVPTRQHRHPSTHWQNACRLPLPVRAARAHSMRCAPNNHRSRPSSSSTTWRLCRASRPARVCASRHSPASNLPPIGRQPIQRPQSRPASNKMLKSKHLLRQPL